MHRAVVLTIFSSAFLVLATLPGTTGDRTIRPLIDENDIIYKEGPDQVLVLPDELFQKTLNFIKRLKPKRGWKDLHGGGWGKREVVYGSPSYDMKEKYMSDRDLARELNLNGDEFESRTPEMDRILAGKKYFGREDPSKYHKYMNDKRDWNSFQGAWGKRDYPLLNGRVTKRDGKWDRLNGGWG